MIFKRPAKALIRLRLCAGWSEPLLVTHTTFLEISCRGSYISAPAIESEMSLNGDSYHSKLKGQGHLLVKWLLDICIVHVLILNFLRDSYFNSSECQLCLFVLVIYIQINIFSVMSFPVFLG